MQQPTSSTNGGAPQGTPTTPTTPPVPAAPIYDLRDPRQWASLALDKGFSVAVAGYLLVSLQQTLNDLKDAVVQNSYLVQQMITELARRGN